MAVHPGPLPLRKGEGETTAVFQRHKLRLTELCSPMLDDTIAAIATPLGEGGLAVVRLSGPRALKIAEQSFEPVGKSSLKPSAAPTHTIHYGRVIRQDRVVDEVLLAVMRAPRTVIREEVVEI